MQNCCQNPARVADRVPPRLFQRISEWLGWIVPAAILTLLPKCPLCLAGYVALATGMAISVPVAVHLRTLLILFAVGFLVLAATNRAIRFLDQRAID